MGQQYDPLKVSVIAGTSAIRGFADGEMINVEYTNDENTVHVGTDGQGRFIKSSDRSGTITVRLADYSTSNAALTTLHVADNPFPVVVTDKSSLADVFFTDSAKVQKRPALVKGNEAVMNEWVITFIRGEITHTGANPT